MIDGDDPASEGGDVFRLVRHDDRCPGETIEVLGDLAAKRRSRRCVDGGERLVEEEDVGFGSKSSRQGNALGLAS